MRLGKMLPFGIYDFFFFKNPKKDFLNASFALNPSMASPSATVSRPQMGCESSTPAKCIIVCN